MIDDMRVSGGTGLPAEISVSEQAQAAGRKPPSYIPHDSIHALKGHCLDVIHHLPGDQRSMGILQAKAKLEELTYWLGYHMTAVQAQRNDG